MSIVAAIFKAATKFVSRIKRKIEQMKHLKEQFLLDPDITFLNHGSFGATPRPVFEAYQRWQRQLEQQPVQFIGYELADYLAQARQVLGNYLHVAADDLVYIPNATFGVNVVANSLDFGSGDEVLTTNHEYGACNNVWNYLSEQRGFSYKTATLPYPITSSAEIVETIWQEVTANTKMIFLSHITSATALRLPIEAICTRAKDAGILTLIDGAHAPGQIPLNLTEIGADFYTGNCQKWMCSPKGAVFLYTHPERQHLIRPLILSWGWGKDSNIDYGSDYLNKLQYLGTDDLTSYLAVPDAIAFQEVHNWTAVRESCHQLAKEACLRISKLTGLDPIYPLTKEFFNQLVLNPLPKVDVFDFKNKLWDDFAVEIPVYEWNGSCYIRTSIQSYNTEEDVNNLLNALQKLL